MERFSKMLKILFIVMAAMVVLEYMFIQGLFTSLIALVLIDIVGVINMIISAKEKRLNETLLYVIATVALSMGYWRIMFM